MGSGLYVSKLQQVSNHTVTDTVISQSLSCDGTWNDKSTSEVLGMHADNRQMSTKPVQKSSIELLCRQYTT